MPRGWGSTVRGRPASGVQPDDRLIPSSVCRQDGAESGGPARRAGVSGVLHRPARCRAPNWHRADDLAQTAFVALHRHWRKVRDKQALDAYVRRTLVRAVIDESRRPWRREKFVDAVPESTGEPGRDLGDGVATREALLDGLRRVPPRQRAVLVLRFLEGMDVASTAELLGCTEGTVKSQTARGLDALRGALGDALDDLRTAS